MYILSWGSKKSPPHLAFAFKAKKERRCVGIHPNCDFTYRHVFNVIEIDVFITWQPLPVDRGLQVRPSAGGQDKLKPRLFWDVRGV